MRCETTGVHGEIDGQFPELGIETADRVCTRRVEDSGWPVDRTVGPVPGHRSTRLRRVREHELEIVVEPRRPHRGHHDAVPGVLTEGRTAKDDATHEGRHVRSAQHLEITDTDRAYFRSLDEATDIALPALNC